MELNMISAGIELLGITVKELEVHNQIVDAEMDAKRVFGLNICEPEFQLDDDTKEIYAEMTIEFDIEIIQADDSSCNIHLSVEGAFVSASQIPFD